MANEKKEQFLSVPYSVLERKDLNDGEKLTLMLIYSYHNNGKEFFMTNLNIGKRLGCSRTAASKRITKLEDMGCIKCDYIFTDGKKEVEKRIITPLTVVPTFTRVVPEVSEVVPEFTTGSSYIHHEVVPEVGSIKEALLLDKELDKLEYNILDKKKSFNILEDLGF